jgi:hypothetical protein
VDGIKIYCRNIDLCCLIEISLEMNGKLEAAMQDKIDVYSLYLYLYVNRLDNPYIHTIRDVNVQ